MSFGTKTSMWWGTVKGNTEHFFGKEQKRLVTHEYYDNPNPPSQRPKSMHTIASQSKRSMGSSNDRGVREGQGFNKKKSDRDVSASRKNSEPKIAAETYPEEGGRGVQDDAMGGAGALPQQQQQAMSGQDGYYPQEDPNMQQQQWGNGYGQDPNGVMYQDQNGMYPTQDPNMMAAQQGNDMMYPQDPSAMTGYDSQGQMYPMQQDPNMMMGGFQQQGMYPQDQSMFPQHPQDPNMYPQENDYPRQ